MSKSGGGGFIRTCTSIEAIVERYSKSFVFLNSSSLDTPILPSETPEDSPADPDGESFVADSAAVTLLSIISADSAVRSVGSVIDVPDAESVVCWPTPSTLLSTCSTALSLGK